jgi:hypothetical protein
VKNTVAYNILTEEGFCKGFGTHQFKFWHVLKLPMAGQKWKVQKGQKQDQKVPVRTV